MSTVTNDKREERRSFPFHVPWGTDLGTPDQERTSTTCTGFKKNRPGFRTIYTLDFQGLPSSRPELKRAATSDHLPTGWPFETTHYSTTFTPKQCSRYTHVQPHSVHRRNNPHPTLFDPWKYPDMRYQIWKPRANALDTIRETASAPNVKPNNKERSWSTTYHHSFQAGKQFDNFPEIKPRTATTKGLNKWNMQAIKTPPAISHISMYQHDFIGDGGRPSTMERPWDRSFQNLSM